MFLTCEVNGCEGQAEHDIGMDKVRVAVCIDHKKAVRALARKYILKLLETTIDIHDEFLNDVYNMKEEG